MLGFLFGPRDATEGSLFLVFGALSQVASAQALPENLPVWAHLGTGAGFINTPRLVSEHEFEQTPGGGEG